MIDLREYQRTAVDQAKVILLERGCVYIAGEPRVRKTPMAIVIAKEVGWKNVCILTKKNAMSGIMYWTNQETMIRWTITNYEQAHKLQNTYDGYIVDEAHNMGAFPVPTKRTKVIKALIGIKKVIFLSGSPTPESKSQIFHQFWLCMYGPFREFSNFYKFAKEYVTVKKKWVNGWQINDYTNANGERIDQMTMPYTVTVSQAEAGFESFVEEEILYVQIDERLYKLMDILKKRKVYKMISGDMIICDTPVKMQSVFHQLSSGTIKIGEDKRVTIDESKAWFIKSKFAGQKIAIFYRYIEEGTVIRKVFPDWTDESDVFNSRTNLTYVKQMVSGREGSNLATADALVMYNIDFSATTYWQVRARMQELDRKTASKLYWIFSKRGLEQYVYQAVVKKKKYTSDYFKSDMKMIGSEQLTLV